jgi:hypothetical protein
MLSRKHLLLAALFFVSFFWANKRKKIELRMIDQGWIKSQTQSLTPPEKSL